MTINAKNLDGHTSHWQLKHMDAGEQRLDDVDHVCLGIANHLAVRIGWSLSKATCTSS